MCIIITEAAEDNDGRNDTVANAQGDNHRKEKEKKYVSTGEWRMITSAINHGTTVPADSRREVLMGYQYAPSPAQKEAIARKK
jgi:hypothetical protein